VFESVRERAGEAVGEEHGHRHAGAAGAVAATGRVARTRE
jgi:hypothetical protein